MHLLIATSSYPLRPDDAFAAAGLFVRDFALEVARRGHRVTVLTHARPGDVVEDHELRVVRHDAPGISMALARLRPWHPADLVKSARLVSAGRRAMRTLVDMDPPDHVLAMWAFPAGLYALDARQRRGIPYSVWALGSDIWALARLPYFRGRIRTILHAAEHCFADGLELGRATAALCGRTCAFLPSARYAPEGTAPEVTWPRAGFQFVFIGRLEWNKGPDVLVGAAGLLRDRGHEFAVTMFGDGTLRRAVEERIDGLRLRDRIVLPGFAPPDVARAYLKAADCVVIPSRIESIPVVFSDALRAGACLVATEVGDLGELVGDHGLGVTAPPGDAAALANAMEAAIRADRTAWRANARRLAPTFSVAAAATTFLRSAGLASALATATA